MLAFSTTISTGKQYAIFDWFDLYVRKFLIWVLKANTKVLQLVCLYVYKNVIEIV